MKIKELDKLIETAIKKIVNEGLAPTVWLTKFYNFLDYGWQEDYEIEIIDMLSEYRKKFKSSNPTAVYSYFQSWYKGNENKIAVELLSDRFIEDMERLYTTKLTEGRLKESLVTDFENRFKVKNIDVDDVLSIIEKNGEHKAIDIIRKKYPTASDQDIDDLIGRYATTPYKHIKEDIDPVFYKLTWESLKPQKNSSQKKWIKYEVTSSDKGKLDKKATELKKTPDKNRSVKSTKVDNTFHMSENKINESDPKQYALTSTGKKVEVFGDIGKLKNTVKIKFKDGHYENRYVEQLNFELDEMSTSAGAGAYMTPNAFSSKTNDKVATMNGYKKVKVDEDDDKADNDLEEMITKMIYNALMKEGIKSKPVLKEEKYIYVDKNIYGHNATKLVRAAGEQGLSKYIKRIGNKRLEITKPKDNLEFKELKDVIDFAVGFKNLVKEGKSEDNVYD